MISRRAAGVVGCFVASALALALAPTLMPSSYSWVSHTTSEAAAQGVSGAWLARLGFLSFGLGVLWLVSGRHQWGVVARTFHGLFGVLMVAAAAFSHRPFIAGLPYDTTEDVLHSISASGMGLAFAFGVAFIAFRRDQAPWGRGLVDAFALAASVAIPLAMTTWPDIAGVLQRGMFLVAYAWYGAEALGAADPSATLSTATDGASSGA